MEPVVDSEGRLGGMLAGGEIGADRNEAGGFTGLAYRDQRHVTAFVRRVAEAIEQRVGGFARREEPQPARFLGQFVEEPPHRLVVAGPGAANRRDRSVTQHQPERTRIVEHRR